MRLLTERQQSFCDFLVNDPECQASPAKAAIKSGYSLAYSKVDVYRSLVSPSIQAELARLRANRSQHHIKSSQEMLDIAWEQFNSCDNPRDKAIWYQEYCKISDMYAAQKVTSNTTMVIKEEMRQELELFKNRLKDCKAGLQ